MCDTCFNLNSLWSHKNQNKKERKEKTERQKNKPHTNKYTHTHTKKKLPISFLISVLLKGNWNSILLSNIFFDFFLLFLKVMIQTNTLITFQKKTLAEHTHWIAKQYFLNWEKNLRHEIKRHRINQRRFSQIYGINFCLYSAHDLA